MSRPQSGFRQKIAFALLKSDTNEAGKNQKAHDPKVQIEFKITVVRLRRMPPVLCHGPNLLSTLPKPIAFKSGSQDGIFVARQKKLPKTTSAFDGTFVASSGPPHSRKNRM